MSAHICLGWFSRFGWYNPFIQFLLGSLLSRLILWVQRRRLLRSSPVRTLEYSGSICKFEWAPTTPKCINWVGMTQWPSCKAFFCSDIMLFFMDFWNWLVTPSFIDLLAWRKFPRTFQETMILTLFRIAYTCPFQSEQPAGQDAISVCKSSWKKRRNWTAG